MPFTPIENRNRPTFHAEVGLEKATSPKMPNVADGKIDRFLAKSPAPPLEVLPREILEISKNLPVHQALAGMKEHVERGNLTQEKLDAVAKHALNLHQAQDSGLSIIWNSLRRFFSSSYDNQRKQGDASLQELQNLITQKKNFIDREKQKAEDAALNAELDRITNSDVGNTEPELSLQDKKLLEELEQLEVPNGVMGQEDADIKALEAKLPDVPQNPIQMSLRASKGTKPSVESKIKTFQLLSQKETNLQTLPSKMTALREAFGLSVSISKELGTLRSLQRQLKQNKDPAKQKELGKKIQAKMDALGQVKKQVDGLRSTFQKQILDFSARK